MTIKGKIKIIVQPLAVTVNYDRSVEDSVKAGKYSFSNHFSNKGLFKLTKRSGTKKIIMELVEYSGDEMYGPLIIAELESKGFRPAEPIELLALGENYPEAQEFFDIAALGNLNGDHCPCLTTEGCRHRTLRMIWTMSGNKTTRLRFAAIRQ